MQKHEMVSHATKVRVGGTTTASIPLRKGIGDCFSDNVECTVEVGIDKDTFL